MNHRAQTPCLIPLICLLGLAGCGKAVAPPPTPAAPAPAAQSQEVAPVAQEGDNKPKDPDPDAHALVRDILERGAMAVAPKPIITMGNDGVEDVYPQETLFFPSHFPSDFTGIVPEHAFHFLKHPNCGPPAHFSCAIRVCPYEQTLYFAARKNPSPSIRLQALALLVAAKSCGVETQDEVIHDLRQEVPEWGDVLDLMAKTLDGKKAAQELTPKNGHAIRVCGYRREPAAVDGLVRLAATDDLDYALAATIALAKIPGEVGDAGLARVVQNWRYNMYVHASATLYRRSPEKLAAALRAMKAPDRDPWKWAYLRIACGDTEAVPLLAAMIPKMQDTAYIPLGGYSIRAKLDAVELIARAATADQAALVHAMPDQVAEEDREKAQRRIDAYFLKWQGKPLVDERK